MILYPNSYIPHNELMVVGGVTPDSDWRGIDSVEIASIV